MTLGRRLQQLELKLKAKIPGCRPALLFLQYEGEEALKPTQEQMDQYLKESGRCQRCTKGKCLIYYDGQDFHYQGDKKTMNLDKRLKLLEVKIQPKQPGCNPTLFIVIPESAQVAAFDTGNYSPADDELEKYLKYLKESGECRNCKGSCAIDYASKEFKNHTLLGERGFLSSGPRIRLNYCANAKTPELLRRLDCQREPRIFKIEVVDAETADLTRRIMSGKITEFSAASVGQNAST